MPTFLYLSFFSLKWKSSPVFPTFLCLELSRLPYARKLPLSENPQFLHFPRQEAHNSNTKIVKRHAQRLKPVAGKPPQSFAAWGVWFALSSLAALGLAMAIRSRVEVSFALQHCTSLEHHGACKRWCSTSFKLQL